MSSNVEIVRRPSTTAERSATVTVVMPTFNRSAYVGEAISSILNQTHQDLILHVHDDGSTDDTLARVLSLSDDLVLLTHGTNVGPAVARNLIVSLASTKYAAMMDSDDISHPRRLAVQLTWLAGHPTIDVVSCGMRAFGPRSHGVLDNPHRSPERVRAHLLRGSAMNFGPACGHRAVFAKFPQNPRYRAAEDYDQWCRMAVADIRMELLPDVLYDCRYHFSNMSESFDARVLDNSEEIKCRYHSHSLSGPHAARFTRWMIWASEDYSDAIRDVSLMDSSLLMALGPGLEGVSSAFIDRNELRYVAREMAVRQYVLRGGLASAAQLPLVAKTLGLRAAAVGAKRIITTAPHPVRGRGSLDHQWPTRLEAG